MDKNILNYLQKITAEEQAILDGSTSIDRDIYMQDRSNTVNAKKLLAAGKLITIRPHTRFIHFPEHTHDYVEVIYMCTGQTTHIVNGKNIGGIRNERYFYCTLCRGNAENTANMYRLGWDERNGGNISYMLDENEVGEYLDLNKVLRTIPLGFDATPYHRQDLHCDRCRQVFQG